MNAGRALNHQAPADTLLWAAGGAPEAAAAAPPQWPRVAALRLSTLSSIADAGAPSDVEPVIARWVRSYLMRPHADLGRPGDVCPFTSQASRLDTIRIGVCQASPAERDVIQSVMQEAIGAFEDIACPLSMRHFRTIIVGFPRCGDAAGLRLLKQVQNTLRPHSIFKGKMIGLFAPGSDDEGLYNRQFRPLRSPIPLLAIRVLVEQDGAFVVRNPLLAPIYLLKFPRSGWRRLLAALRS